ncbi:MAG: hypothetical protein DA408_18075 [Bacteroidetes bacterium]|nr:MAG: hypothetical protein C7N36_21095 [Bacteroidota bacterium]PTM09549.1 MAG: hypothetical protein DA408_18075 [Bacteroidota bacterium]
MYLLLLAFSLPSWLGFLSNNDVAPVVDQTAVIEIFAPLQRAAYFDQELSFWSSKLAQAPNQLSYHFKLAGLYNERFAAYGQIDDLCQAESLLQYGLQYASIQRPAFLRALARTYISQHRFQEAYALVTEALAIGENPRANSLIQYDVLMELGRYQEAEQVLAKIYQQGGFQYLIRKAKWEDHQGNLDFAIAMLEEAKANLNAQDQEQAIWLYSNLGDFYGHHGEVAKAYTHYLMTLQLDPTNWYAIKGMAWIAYAHDGNIPLAKTLLQTIMRTNDTPDLHLRLAELYAYEGDAGCAEAETAAFLATAQALAYGRMYSGPISEILVATGQGTTALAMATKEVEQRATPTTYDMLAWVHFKTGNLATAQAIAQQHVIGQTHEPVAQLHLLDIFADDAEMAKTLRAELATARFELGPLTYQQIKREK